MHVCVCMYVYARMCMHVCVCMYVCVHVCMYMPASAAHAVSAALLLYYTHLTTLLHALYYLNTRTLLLYYTHFTTLLHALYYLSTRT